VSCHLILKSTTDITGLHGTKGPFSRAFAANTAVIGRVYETASLVRREFWAPTLSSTKTTTPIRGRAH
jgi:hypothetical protein